MKPFKLNGKPMSDALELSPARRIAMFLDTRPGDELFDSPELANLLAITPARVTQAASDVRLEGYSALVHVHKRYWGNPKAVAEWRRRHEVAICDLKKGTS